MTGDRLAEATDWFVRLRSDAVTVDDLMQFQQWIGRHAGNAAAYRKCCAAWDGVGVHAAAPEIMIGRRDALEQARRSSRRHWSGVWPPRSRLAVAAAAAGLALTATIASWLGITSRGPVFETHVGEQRTLMLSDGSVVALDAHSRIRVTYSDDARVIALEEGQARFDVAKDPLRPFRVRAGPQVVQALGTQFNVELVADTVRVTLIEGHLAVSQRRTGLLPMIAEPEQPVTSPIEMHAGQQLVARPENPASLRTNVDVAEATGWQVGKLFFDNEPLASACERINRYAREQITVHPSAAGISVSGVFRAGDSNAFVEAVAAYFPVTVQRSRDGRIELMLRGSDRLPTSVERSSLLDE